MNYLWKEQKQEGHGLPRILKASRMAVLSVKLQACGCGASAGGRMRQYVCLCTSRCKLFEHVNVYLSIKCHSKVFQHSECSERQGWVRWCLWVCRSAGRPLPDSSRREKHHTELNKMELTRELVAVAWGETSVSAAIRCYNVWITWRERRKSKDVINRSDRLELPYHTNKSVCHLKYTYTQEASGNSSSFTTSPQPSPQGRNVTD